MNKSALLFLKVIVIGGLALIILVALYLVDGIISSRQAYRDEAVTSISASYASEQRVLGPLFVQPYRQVIEEHTTEKGIDKITNRTIDSSFTVFPHDLTINGSLNPSVRRHGLYRVPVYEFQGVLKGHIDVPTSTLSGKVTFGIPYLAFTVKDARGIVGTPSITINGTPVHVLGATLSSAEQNNAVHPDLLWGTNLRSLLPDVSGKASSFNFLLNLTLAGTEKLQIVPVADSNYFELTSTWAEPLFAGQFLPRTREISSAGFHAVWEISSLASATQQQLIANSQQNVDVIDVSLSNAIDPYKLSDRAVKYGILFVLLTFGGFFLFEMGKRMLIHPVQYLLVGFCLSVFFLLLISFSEHMSFALAYLISSVACIGLLTYYLVFVLRSIAYGLGFGAILATLYAAIYGLLISEDNALLLGSLLLFGVVAVVMIITRKVDWYQKTAEVPQGPSPKSPAAPV